MNLSKKTFLYSISISVLIVAFMAGYFIWMVPSLYVDYVQNGYYESIIETHQTYMKEHSYENIKVQNPAGAVSIEIPQTGNSIYVAGKYFRATVTLQDENTLELLRIARSVSFGKKDLTEVDVSEETQMAVKRAVDQVLEGSVVGEDAPFQVVFDQVDDEETYKILSEKIHVVSDHIFLYEGSITDDVNYYTSYMAFSKEDETMIISFLPVMTPQIDEVQPIMLKSLPMIVAVAVFIMLITSQIFSRIIITPIIRLARYSQNIDTAGAFEIQPLEIKGRDEISDLGRTLNELYERLQQNYRELQKKNAYLMEENQRHEVFLRASSHQLKTPIAAALLLVEGMIGEVGKYKDTKTYLPKVKSQLQSMKKMVEDILYLNHCADHLEIEPCRMREVAEGCMGAWRIQADAKELQVSVHGDMRPVLMDREIMTKIVDNLLSNAVRYTPAKEQVEVLLDESSLRVRNYGVRIGDELLPHVLEPFVTSNEREKGHGLGLYVAAYYAELLGWKLEIHNLEQGVEAILSYVSAEQK